MITFEEVQEAVINWGDDKGILTKSTPSKQLLKTLEELGELAAGTCRDDEYLIKDSVGDVLVTLILYCELQGISLVECLVGSYNEIAMRNGKMVDGVFVKE